MAVIEVESLRKAYGTTVAVDGLGFDVAEGEVFGILGPNGAGKTTTVECLSGLRRPDSGTVRVLGLDPHRDRRRLSQVVGTQLQRGLLPDDLQVGEALRLYRSFYRDAAEVDQLLDDLGLTEKRTTRFKDLSGGQAQRLSVALALIGRPRIAILDELTTGLDPLARRRIWSMIEKIRDLGVTVVLVTHVMEEAERLCDRIAIIDAGRLVALDSPTGLIDRVDVGQRLRLRTATALDPALLAGLRDLPEVETARPAGGAGEIVLTGTGNLLHAVTSALLGAGITPTATALERATLDDAYLCLTGRAPKSERTEEDR